MTYKYLKTDENIADVFFGCTYKPLIQVEHMGGATFIFRNSIDMYIACYKLSNLLVTDNFTHSPELAFYPYITNKNGVNFYPTIQRGNELGYLREGAFFI
jgi:hypothetical protein